MCYSFDKLRAQGAPRLSAAELQVAYDQCRDGNTKIRFQAVRLYGTGMATAEILPIAGCSRSSLMNWTRNYQAKGIAGLIDNRTGGNSAKLAPYQIEQLHDQLQSDTPEQLLGPDAMDGQWQISVTAHASRPPTIPPAMRRERWPQRGAA